MKFCVNNTVRIRLTDTGRKIVARDDMWFDEEKDGVTEVQLWKLIRAFGEHMNSGFDAPFEMVIEIDKKYLTEDSESRAKRKPLLDAETWMIAMTVPMIINTVGFCVYYFYFR